MQYRSVPGFSDITVSSCGSSVRMGETELKLSLSHDGYIMVYLRAPYKKSVAVHRLVAAAYLERSNKPYVNHLDGNKANNLPCNLEYVTTEENNRHARNILNTASRLPRGERHYASKLTNEQRTSIQNSIEPLSVLAERYNVSKGAIQNTRGSVKLLRTQKQGED
jgi:hypothetical protein